MTPAENFSDLLWELVDTFLIDGNITYSEMIGILEVAKMNVYQELLEAVTKGNDNKDE